MPPPPGPPLPADPLFGGTCEAFVTRLDATGTSISWSTFFGGNDIDVGYGVEGGAAGTVYVAGCTRSEDIPIAPPAPQIPFQATYGGNGDGFVLKLDPAGTSIHYSSYLGSGDEDTATDLKVDGLGNAYVCGYTYWVTGWGTSPDFPTTPANVIEPRTGGDSSGFVSKIATDGTYLLYSTFVRGLAQEMRYPFTECIAIALHIDDSDPTNVNAFVTGRVQNAETYGIPLTGNAFQQTPGGGEDAFVIGLNATATAHVYGSYYGGSNQDIGFDLAAYSEGLALTGRTYSTNLTLVNPWQSANNGNGDAFIARFQPYASPSVSFSTYLGGVGLDQGTAVDTDGTGRNLYCVGLTYWWAPEPGQSQPTPHFPTTSDALFTTPLDQDVDGQDIFFCKFQSNNLVYSTYLGGGDTDEAYGLAKDPSGYYIAGMSAGQDFYSQLSTQVPGLPGYQPTNQGGPSYSPGSWKPEWPVMIGTVAEQTDAFVLKLLSP
ncbi:MAG: SBBP repeat-containing protein [Planctomycetes bacterium]|nr:SBBP repeat-containing protein [Planctomycetota bacterium]